MAGLVMRDNQTILLRLRLLLLIALSLMLAGVALLSLRWNYGYDTAQMLYYGRLIGQLHFVPYRDIWEENLPGAILAYTAIGALIDYSNAFLLRIFDLIYLTAISLSAWRWLQPLGRQVAWAACVLFGVVYLLGGPGFSTQREYVFLLPIVAALAVATWSRPMPDARRALIVGLLFGIATTIKPHAGIGLAAVVVYHYFDIRARQNGVGPGLRQILIVLAAYGLGVAIPVAAMMAYLVVSGSLRPWLDIVTNYWPLYSTLSSQMDVLTGASRVQYVVSSLASMGGQGMWLITAAAGTVVSLWSGVSSASQRRRVWLMVGQLMCYTLYPTLTGQFYPQHWLPMTYFILAVSALCFVALPESARWPLAATPLAALCVALALSGDVLAGGISQMVDYSIYHRPIPSSDGDRSAEIAGYLEDHLQPEDTVQPLDQVGYGMHGMLLARAAPATRFQADAPFYERPDLPYIQGLRAEFMNALNQKPPRYIIDVVARARVQTNSRVIPFAEFDRLVREDYSPVYVGHGFLIYERVTQQRAGLIVYPSEYSGLTPVDTAPFKADLLTFAAGRPADSHAALSRRLRNFGAMHDLLVYENLGEDSESSAAVEGWLNRRAYRLSERQFAATRLLEYLSPRLSCGTLQAVGLQFGDEIRLRSASASLLALEAGRFVCVQLEMEAVRSPHRAYLISAHVIGAAGRSVAQYDSQPQGNLLPTTAWEPGQQVADQFALRLPADLPPGDYQVRLYVSDVETGQPVATGDGAGYALLGSIQLP